MHLVLFTFFTHFNLTFPASLEYKLALPAGLGQELSSETVGQGEGLLGEQMPVKCEFHSLPFYRTNLESWLFRKLCIGQTFFFFLWYAFF